MIGGADIHLAGQPSPHEADLILRTIRVAWPQAVMRRADGLAYVTSPVLGPIDVLVFRDRDAEIAWSAHGGAPQNQSSMMQVIVGVGGTTIVVDESDSKLAELARELLRGAQYNRARMPRTQMNRSRS